MEIRRTHPTRASLLPGRDRRLARGIFLGFAAGILVTGFFVRGVEAETIEDRRAKMGSRFEIVAVHPDADVARAAIEDAYGEIDRIEAVISSWREDSETSAVNRAAGGDAVEVSPELFGLVRRGLKVAELTGGAFDLTFASVGRLWDFQAAEPRLPDPEDIAVALAKVGSDKVELDAERHAIRLTTPGTRIGFGALGKGYAANRAVALLRERGIAGGLVNAGGDLLAFGRREDGGPWTVGIADPRRPGAVFARLDLSGMAVVTSGDYERYVEIDGKRYAHILDPRTGYPVEHMISVTIVCPDAELADALATAVFVLGPDEGLALIDRLKSVEGLLVDGEGRVRLSKNLQSRMVDGKDGP